MKAQILVVEDESDIRQLIGDALEGQGYDIIMCNNAMNARTQVARKVPDLAIVDWMMPQVSGIDLVTSFRNKQETSHIPIIMLTARSEENDMIEGLEAGADDYITKPFSPRELLTRVKAVLRRSTGHQNATVLTHGDIKLHPESMRITVGDQPVSLGQLEFKLLHFMLQNPERVFSREQLLNNVWGVNHFVEERTVDVHVLRLRKALRAHGVEKLIDTVRGAGYRLASPTSD